MYYNYFENIFWGRRVAGEQGCECNATVVCSIPIQGNELLFVNILISSFRHQGKMPSVEFRYSTRNAAKNSVESAERSILTLGSPLSCYMRYSVKLIYFLNEHFFLKIYFILLINGYVCVKIKFKKIKEIKYIK